MKTSDKIRLIFLILILAAAVYYPVRKILAFEYPEIPPKEFRFRTGAVDPYDPFRGRYITLRPQPDTIKANANENFRRGARVYAVLDVDADGFAIVKSLDSKPPSGNVPFVMAEFYYTSPKWDRNYKKASKETYHHIMLPFNRFYINENFAADAERLVAETVTANRNDCVIVVRVYSDGSSAIKELLLKGKPLHQCLKEKSSENRIK